MKRGSCARLYWILASTLVLAISSGCRSDAARAVTPPVDPTPGPPASMTVLSGDRQVAVVGEVLPVPITIVVRDAAGRGVPNLKLSLTRVDPAGIRSYPGSFRSLVTDESGVMSVVVTLDSASGPMAFEVAVPGASIVVAQGRNGNPDPVNPQGASYAYFFTVVPVSNSSPYMALVRLPLSQLNRAARPGNAIWEYFKPDSTWSRWPETDTTLPSDHAVVMNPGATEMTVRYHTSTTSGWQSIRLGWTTKRITVSHLP